MTIIICLKSKSKIWIDRLQIFPLGPPDDVQLIVEEEILNQLKEEIARNAFNESLL